MDSIISIWHCVIGYIAIGVIGIYFESTPGVKRKYFDMTPGSPMTPGGPMTPGSPMTPGGPRMLIYPGKYPYLWFLRKTLSTQIFVIIHLALTGGLRRIYHQIYQP